MPAWPIRAFLGGDSRNLEIQKSRNLEPNGYKRVIAILLRFFEGVKPLAAGKPSRNRRAGVAGSSPGKPGDDAMSQGKCGEGGALQGISFPAGSLRWRKAGAQRLTTPPASLPCSPCARLAGHFRALRVLAAAPSVDSLFSGSAKGAAGVGFALEKPCASSILRTCPPVMRMGGEPSHLTVSALDITLAAQGGKPE